MFESVTIHCLKNYNYRTFVQGLHFCTGAVSTVRVCGTGNRYTGYPGSTNNARTVAVILQNLNK